MMKSKKTLAKSGPRGTKLVFDEDGQAHRLYEFKDVEDVDVERDGAEFIRKEIGKMQKADAGDKAAAKEKKKEKKRKRKEREREERGEDGLYSGPAVAPSDDDGYVSPAFDLPPESKDDRTHSPAPPKKRPRKADGPPATLEEEEAHALRFLRR